MKYLLLSILLCTGCPDNIPAGPIPCSGVDSDNDGILLNCDNCENTANSDQSDIDYDGIGDLCDADMDNDGIKNSDDLCPKILAPENVDTDGDGIGDACDPCPNGDEDSDDDGVVDCVDTCPNVPDPKNLDTDGDGIGDVCDICPETPDAHQNTTNGLGDACNDTAFSIQELTISELHKALKAESHSCEDIAELFLVHIGAHDLSVRGNAPARNAFVSFNEGVRDQARQLDLKQKETGLLPLHCVPFVVKTNYEAPEIETTGGTHALSGTRSRTNSPSVERLRKAGALLLASTSMDELARGTDGISSTSGRTGNAYDPRLYPGGSSSGSGVAVGSNFSIFGLGTDNCASLLLPATLNGLTSFRSTHQLIETSGMFPSGISGGVAGPMTRTVEDLARVMDYMVSPERPESILREGWKRPKTYRDHLVVNGLDGKRIGILRKLSDDVPKRYKHPFRHYSVEKTHEWNRLIRLMESEGATIVDNVTLPRFDGKRAGGGFVTELDKWFKRVDSPVEDAEGMCNSDAFSSFIWGSPAICLSKVESGRDDGGVLRAIGNRRRFYQNAAYVESVMDALDVDVLIYPTTAYGEARRGGGRVNCLFGSTTGMPSLTVITSKDSDNRRPFGLTISARSFDEASAFEVAYALEIKLNARTKPVFIPPVSEIPTFDPKVENELRHLIGDAASAHFKGNKKGTMTHSRMREVLVEVLTAKGRSELLE